MLLINFKIDGPELIQIIGFIKVQEDENFKHGLATSGNRGANGNRRVFLLLLFSKGNQHWIFTGKTDAKVPIFGQLSQRANSLEKTLMLGKFEGKKRRGWQRMRWLESITNSRDMNLSKLRKIEEDREVWHAVQSMGLQRVGCSLATEQQKCY